MTNIQAVSRERHTGKSWKPIHSFAFAAQSALVVLTVSELAKACGSMPVAFKATDGEIVPVAVLGLRANECLFVAPTDQWVGNYVPAALRNHPFRVASGATDKLTLCVDEDSDLIGEAGEGEAFFAEDGQPTKATADVLNALVMARQGQLALKQMAGLLYLHQVLEDWPIAIREGEEQRLVPGLLRVSEAKLNALNDEGFLQLRRGRALTLAYAQLFSMQNIAVLGRLATAHEAYRLTQEQRQQKQAAYFQLNCNDLDEKFDWNALLKDE